MTSRPKISPGKISPRDLTGTGHTRRPASNTTSAEISDWVPSAGEASAWKRVYVRSRVAWVRYVTPTSSSSTRPITPAELSREVEQVSEEQASVQPDTQEVRPGPSRIRRTDVEPLQPSGNRQLLLRKVANTYQAVLMEGAEVVEHYVEPPHQHSLVGNIYLGVITAVVPSLSAVFVDIGIGSHGILRPPGGLGSVKTGDRILVRVTKDAYGSKGPKLRADLSLTGRYLVLLPGTQKIAVSRHLMRDHRIELRNRIQGLLEAESVGGRFGVIARSSAVTAPDEDLVRDLRTLLETWAEVEAVDVASGPAPRLVLSEPDLPIRIAREYFTSDYKRLITDDPKACQLIRTYLSKAAPDLVSRVILDSSDIDLFSRFHVFDQLRRALDRKVYLPSGGHLVIDEAEALTAIDVNTGRFAGDDAYEDVILANNLEAAVEAARQIRLRDIGGIVVIDFIDMANPDHRAQVLDRFRAALAKDRTTTDVLGISDLGLVEMTRKRRSTNFLDSFSNPCAHCAGRGIIVESDSELLRPSSPGKPSPSSAAQPDTAAESAPAVKPAGSRKPSSRKSSQRRRSSRPQSGRRPASDKSQTTDSEAA